MLIEFRCTNTTDFDAATGRGGVCDERLVAPEEKMGDQIVCKKCGQSVEVPFESQAAASAQRSARSRRPSVAATRSKKQPLKKKSGRRSKKTDELSLDAPVDRQPPDVMTFEFEAETNSNLNTSAQRRCPKCGDVLDGGRCVGCRYVEKRYPSSYLPLENLQLKPAGFQRYASAIFNEGVSFNYVLYGFHILVGVLAAVLLSCALVVGGITGVALGILLAVFGGMYVFCVIASYSLARNPGARVPIVLKPMWNLLLSMARRSNWQGYDARFKGRLIIDKRKAPIVDGQIPELEGLPQCQVLDLEGTLVTDAGLKYLYGLSNLHCLVVRKTRVTQEGVVRLQQSNPKMWVWL